MANWSNGGGVNIFDRLLRSEAFNCYVAGSCVVVAGASPMSTNTAVGSEM